MVTIENAEQALKTVYLGVLSNQLNVSANPLLSEIKNSTEDVWGKEVRRVAPFGINGGFGAGTEDGNLPVAAGNKYVQFVSTLKNLYGQIQLSDKALRASSNSVGAFVDLLNSEMDGLLKAASFNLGRMLYGDGSGKLCSMKANSVAENHRNIIEGMMVDVYDDMDCIRSTKPWQIVSIDRSSGVVTFSGGTCTAGESLYLQGSRDKEITGLGRIFSMLPLYGVTRTTNAWMVPRSYIAVTNTELTEMLIQENIDMLEINADSQVNFIACSPGLRRAFQNHLLSYRMNVDVMELKGGYKSISYNGIPIVADRFVPKGSIYMLNTKDFKLHQLCDWKWLENETGKILRQDQGKPTYSATLVKYAELICDKPGGQALVSNLKEA